jgi:quercetin dioxygenase-like cupin family protein
VIELHEFLRDRAQREHRLDPDWFHLLPLQHYSEALRAEPEYERNGHNGMILIKTRHLRAVLEVAKAGQLIPRHTVHGPSLIQVLEGTMEVQARDQTRVTHAGVMAVFPQEWPRLL